MRNENLNSLAIAIFLCANPIAWSISFLPNAIVFITVFSWLIVAFNKELFNIIKSPFYTHLFVLSTVVIFLFSMNKNLTDSLVDYFTFFIVCGVTGIYFSNLNFSIKKVFQYIAIIALFISFFVNTIDFGDPTVESVDYGMWMGISYGILRLVLAILVIFLMYRNDYSLWLRILFVIAIILYCVIFAKYGSRGSLVAVLLFLFTYYLLSLKSSFNKFFVLLSVFIFSIPVLINFDTFIVLLSDLLQEFGIQINAIDKLLLLSVSGDIDNGRNHLIDKALTGFYESPFWGNGIAGFEERYGTGYYIHNVLLQILYEGGIILFIPILLVFIGSIIILFYQKMGKEQKVFVLFLFSAGIIELLFSNVYWKSMFFWFYVFYNIRLLINSNFGKS